MAIVNYKFEMKFLDGLFKAKDNLINMSYYLIHQAQKQEINDITNLKLQKLIFYSYAHYLVQHKNKKTLFDYSIEAWPYGPVIPTLYFLFRGNQGKPINKEHINAYINTNQIIGKDSIDYILAKYGKKTGIELTDKTHSEDPWINAWRLNQRFEERIIERDHIYEYYKINKL
ncbi:Panacea domain-containing protein [Candidatus Phytoplasma pruni]|uniref:DUF4065 domain-containing protein n=1 Tax=Candidatus Phytoplasma pruni TaxID=479893 RepID=A0A851HCW1_9MOLU|nr:type II toxin-antitoxin system antitoxin SocA domain-containing protein [Candidatus Phytoplasma pruni]NWN45911.1 DUF4065 domain-containing protein [Candidatus Phytoplasma pruni]